MAVEKIRKGDYVWAKPEGDPGGPGEWKLVVEVFSRTAPVREVRLPGGRVIGTTNEHPFYARPMSDWLRAGSLQAGDELTGMGGEWTAVLGVEDTGKWERVYNVQVADHHTYFVGGDDWGFSVWRTTPRRARSLRDRSPSLKSTPRSTPKPARPVPERPGRQPRREERRERGPKMLRVKELPSEPRFGREYMSSQTKPQRSCPTLGNQSTCQGVWMNT